MPELEGLRLLRGEGERVLLRRAMETSPIILGYMLTQVESDVVKLPNNPSLSQKWALIQRLFIIMMKIYNMGNNKEE